MQVQNINNTSYNSKNTNFNGYIGKPVYNFINEVKNDVLKTKPQYANKKELEMLLEDIPQITKNLRSFMQDFHPNTCITLKKQWVKSLDEYILNPHFENTDTKTSILGYQAKYKDKYINGVGENGIDVFEPKILEPSTDFFGFKSRWSAYAVHTLRKYVDALTNSNISPKTIDKQLFKKMIEGMEESSNLPMFKIFGDVLAKQRGKKADKLAPQFGFEPIYRDKFLEIAKKARYDEKIRLQEENSIKDIMKKLKNTNVE